MESLKWRFPLDHCHKGILHGNATTGLMIWGEDNTLKITIGRADFWDHRGGKNISKQQNYKTIKELLKQGDEKQLKAIFSDCNQQKGMPERPSILPVGRYELVFDEGVKLCTGELFFNTGLSKITAELKSNTYEMTVFMSMTEQAFSIKVPEQLGYSVKPLPSWAHQEEYFRSVSIEAPEVENNAYSGWFQPLPEDLGLCVMSTVKKNDFYCINARLENNNAIEESKATLNHFIEGHTDVQEKSKEWWNNYWLTSPVVETPNETLNRIYYYSIYKTACYCQPMGIPGTLQGPWIEDHQLPPWSSDYHFNINVQMCYWPVFRANKAEFIKPLFDMIWSWRDQLQSNARNYIGIDDGYMLPHAVDDRCVCMGGFWSGTIDHACTVWMALMMFDYYQYSGDKDFLAEIGYPFMKGAMRVFEELLEFDGTTYELPVSVSPEYGGDAIWAWGKNASFQLASIHKLCERLLEAGRILKEPPKELWSDILSKLPKAALIGEGENKELALWEGKGLEVSHRHHSHLGAIFPFDTIDVYDDKWRKTIHSSVETWIRRGTGLWTGWCITWASILWTRFGKGETAELFLNNYDKIFTNEGYGTLHDSKIPGYTLFGFSDLYEEEPQECRMQVDAGMGALAAVQEMFVHERRGIISIMKGIPKSWEKASVEQMLAPGGFLIDALHDDYRFKSAKIYAQRNGTATFEIPNKGDFELKYSNGQIKKATGGIIEIKLEAGENVIIQ